MVNFNYIKENNKAFRNMIDAIVDSKPVTDAEARQNWKNNVLCDWIDFLYKLNYLTILPSNPLYNQQKFSNGLFRLCDSYKQTGLDTIASDRLENLLKTMHGIIKDWVYEGLDAELARQEKEFYSKLAFSQTENASQQLSNRTAQLKEAALMNIHKPRVSGMG
jgi:hypothetical protein